MIGATTLCVLSEVWVERDRQEAKWGEQNHPNGTGPMTELSGFPEPVGLPLGTVVRAPYADDVERWARDRCADAHRHGEGTYEQILTEEWAEAVASADPRLLRRELLKVAAVAVAWVEKIDRDAIEAAL